jgi:hypothetical protein
MTRCSFLRTATMRLPGTALGGQARVPLLLLAAITGEGGGILVHGCRRHAAVAPIVRSEVPAGLQKLSRWARERAASAA